MNNKKLLRLLAVFAREGLDVRHDDGVWSVRLDDDTAGPEAHVLLPDGFPVEGKALRQLATLAATRHPAGGHVCRCGASPDFHPGDGGVAIGSVAEMQGLVVPAAVGNDIHCGMRLHMLDVDEPTFQQKKQELVRLLSGFFFLGTRDLPMTGRAFRALFEDGLPGLLSTWEQQQPRGFFRDVDVSACFSDLDRVFDDACLKGSCAWMPDGLLPELDEEVRDDGLGTIGGGNHFVEIQIVDEIRDPQRAWQLGVKRHGLAVMIHSGSRHVGKHVGSIFAQKAKEAWPASSPHPRGSLFGISPSTTPELFAAYLQAEAAAGHYAWLNRMALAEMVKRAVREIFHDVRMPLVFDVPHNLTRQEGDGYVVRKGACPAHEGQPVIIPGSMGTSSFLCVGRGNDRFLSTASHGAGRVKARGEMSHTEEDLGLDGVECVTPRAERRIEEAPAAYKPIEPVVQAQVDAGVVDVVARLRPLLTFKA